SHAFLMIFALGSKFLYTLWPNPIRRKLSFLSLALFRYFLASPPSFFMASSISITAWLAPPCNGPHSALIPAATDEYKLACADPTILTVEVEQFCSWSAWRIRSTFSASATSGSTTYSWLGRANIICRKFEQ